MIEKIYGFGRLGGYLSSSESPSYSLNLLLPKLLLPTSMFSPVLHGAPCCSSPSRFSQHNCLSSSSLQSHHPLCPTGLPHLSTLSLCHALDHPLLCFFPPPSTQKKIPLSSSDIPAFFLSASFTISASSLLWLRRSNISCSQCLACV